MHGGHSWLKRWYPKVPLITSIDLSCKTLKVWCITLLSIFKKIRHPSATVQDLFQCSNLFQCIGLTPIKFFYWEKNWGWFIHPVLRYKTRSKFQVDLSLDRTLLTIVCVLECLFSLRLVTLALSLALIVWGRQGFFSALRDQRRLRLVAVSKSTGSLVLVAQP